MSNIHGKILTFIIISNTTVNMPLSFQKCYPFYTHPPFLEWGVSICSLRILKTKLRKGLFKYLEMIIEPLKYLFYDFELPLLTKKIFVGPSKFIFSYIDQNI